MQSKVSTGDVYGRLTIIKEASPKRYPSGDIKRRVRCQCSCGRITTANLNSLRTGHTSSCGCFASEQTSKSHTSHGRCGTPEYNTWKSMLDRCRNQNNQDWHYYGGRGITVASRWLGKEGFQNFYRDMGPRPSVGHSIDRIDTNKGYGPDNCRWATLIQQRRNQRNNRVIEFRGKKQCLIEWSIELGTKYKVLQERLADGWTVERAFTTSHNSL